MSTLSSIGASDRPVNRPKAPAEIIARLRTQISSGELARGDQLPSEKELARQFGVSQPTVREAVRALDAMGLLDVRHGRGVYVSQDLSAFVSNTLQTYIEFERVGLADTLQVRGALGRLSARQAASLATDVERDALVAAATACDEAVAGTSRSEDMALAVVNFQSAVSAAARNPLLYAVESFLIRILLQLQVDAKAAHGREYWTKQLDNFRADRWEVTNRILDGDPPGAERAMETYLEDQRLLFENDAEMASARLRRVDGSPESILLP